jgi:NhaP-type Na+/H+ or K+/H+ antiporter
MPANALAWAFGMVIVFAGIDLALGEGFGPGTVTILVLTLLLCGATVGAIHGLALMWLLRPARRLDPQDAGRLRSS